MPITTAAYAYWDAGLTILENFMSKDTRAFLDLFEVESVIEVIDTSEWVVEPWKQAIGFPEYEIGDLMRHVLIASVGNIAMTSRKYFSCTESKKN